MDGERAERYHLRRLGELEARRVRQQEWDFLARILSPDEIAGAVGVGWRPLVAALHDDLIDVDRDYRLYELKERNAGLLVVARFARDAREAASRRLVEAKAEALRTCEVCGGDARPRMNRPQPKTLCDRCSAADRAAAAEQGERYADAVLQYLMSGDAEHPTPEETLAWLDALDAS